MKYPAFVLLALALPLSACGGASLDAVAKAATNATAAGSEHVDLSGSVLAAGEKVEMTGSGDFQTSPKVGVMHLSLDAGGQRLAMDEVMKGLTIYMRSPVFATELPAGKSWVSIDLQKATQKLGVNLSQYAQEDPTDTLAALRQAGSVKKLGKETIDGVDTTHYHATVDLSKSAGGQQAQKLANLKAVPVDVWIDDNNLLRRMTLNYTETVSGSPVVTSMKMDFSKYGETVNAKAPSAGETVDMTSLGG